MTGPRSGHRRSRTPSPLLALLGSLRRTAIGPLPLGAMVLLALVAAVRPSYLQGLFGFAVLPTGAGVLAVLAWRAQAPAWQIVLTRSPGVRWALLGVLAVVVAMTCVFAGMLMLAIGDDAARVASRVAVGIPLGWAGVALTLWLHTRFRVAVALVTALGGLTEVVFGGSTLAGSWLWLAGPSGWMRSATGPARTAVAIALSLTVTAAATTAWLRRLRHPRRNLSSRVTSVASVAPDAPDVTLATPDPGPRGRGVRGQCSGSWPIAVPPVVVTSPVQPQPAHQQ